MYILGLFPRIPGHFPDGLPRPSFPNFMHPLAGLQGRPFPFPGALHPPAHLMGSFKHERDNDAGQIQLHMFRVVVGYCIV